MPFNKTTFEYIQGKVKWFRPVIVNQWNKWSTQIHPNDAGVELIRELQAKGLKNQLKKDEDGYYVSFTRPATKTIKSGKTIAFAPVEVFDKDGVPFTGAVGNASDVTLKIEVYKHETPTGKKAVAARWVSARIDNLVPYEPDRDHTADQQV